MRDDYEEFEKRGAQVIAVGQGGPVETAEFCGNEKIPFPCMPDPDRDAYHAYHLPQGTLGQTMGFKVAAAARDLKARTGIGVALGPSMWSTSSWSQMPGMFLIDKRGITRWAHVAQDAADIPPNAVVLAALDAMKD